MSDEHASKVCKGCGDVRVLALRPRPNHVLHLLITLTTCGAWAFVWLALVLFRPAWRCSACGLALR